MNWLAHIFLSEKEINFQLGNLLADPLKGKSWPNANKATLEGIKLHKKIDSYTDSHAHVSVSKSRLGKKGYLKPVVIDIVYDHLLHKHWDNFAEESLQDFMQGFYREARIAVGAYPKEAQRFVNRVIQSQVLTSYSDIDGLATAFKRIDTRLSPRLRQKESTIQYLPVVEKEMPHLEQDFMEFFPQLQRYTNQHIDRSQHDRRTARKD